MVESADILKQVPQCPVPFLAPPAAPSSGPAVIQQSPGSDVTQQAGSQSVPSQTTPYVSAGSQSLPYSSPVSAVGPGSQAVTAQSGIMASSQQIESQPQSIGHPGVHSSPPSGVSTRDMKENQQGITVLSTANVSHSHIGNARSFSSPSQGSSGPALLPVTQLPSAQVSPAGTSHIVEDDDDFADFQAAAPAAPVQTNLPKSTVSR